MPIYEYECKKCDKTKEILTSQYQHIEWCKTCGEEMKRLISRSTFHLKGGGWYATDEKSTE